MARFYGTMTGAARSGVSRIGGEQSGVTAHVRGWDIGGKVDVHDRKGKDVVLLRVTGGTNGPSCYETPWIEVVRDPKTGKTEITVRPGPDGKVILW